MADKVRKLKDAAARHLAKGRPEKALEALLEVVQLEPQDLPSRQKCGDLYRKLRQNDKAIEAYQAVAGAYAADGMLLKSIAVCKVILQLDKEHTETQQTLAELYARKRGRGRGTLTEMPAAMSAAMGAERTTSSAAMRAITGQALPQVAPAAPNPELEPAPEPVRTATAGHAAMAAIGIDMGTAADAAADAAADDVDGIDLDLGPESVEVVAPPAPPVAADDAITFLDIDDDEGEEIEMAVVEGTEMPPPEPRTVDLSELPPIPLFSDLSKNAFIELLERMELRRFEDGESVVQEGDEGDSFFIIAGGGVRIQKSQPDGQIADLACLGEGAFFGEMALLGDGRRSANVVADGDTDIFEVSRGMLDAISTSYPSVQQVMMRFCKQRLLANLLATSPIFAPFDRAARKQLIEKFKSRTIKPRTAVLSEGQIGDGLYVLLSGRAEVVSKATGRKVVLAELRAGDVFGEMSLLTQQAVSASINTVSTCIVLRLPARTFKELIMTHPQILELVSRLSASRSQDNAQLLAAAIPEQPTTSDEAVRV